MPAGPPVAYIIFVVLNIVKPKFFSFCLFVLIANILIASFFLVNIETTTYPSNILIPLFLIVENHNRK